MVPQEIFIPLRWEHLTLGEQQMIGEQMPDHYEGWEITHGYYTREHGTVLFVEDAREH